MPNHQRVCFARARTRALRLARERTHKRAPTLLAVAVLASLLGCSINVQGGNEPASAESQGGEAKAGRKGNKRENKPKPVTDKDDEAADDEGATETPKDDKPKNDDKKPDGKHDTKKPDGNKDDDKPKGDQSGKDDSEGKPDGKDTGKDKPDGKDTGKDKPDGKDTGKDSNVSDDPKSHVRPDKDEKPAGESTFVVPVRVPLAEAVAKIDALVPKTAEENEWVRVTKAGDSPEVEIRYKVWRDKLKVSFDKHTFTVVVPLHYAANYRAKIQNPIISSDWITLTENDTWGTKAEPQDMTVTLKLKPSVEGDWKIEAEPALESVTHGKPPTGKACVKVGIKACVEKDTLAPKVRAHIDGYITPKIEDALKKADRELAEALRLEKNAKHVWQALQQPLSLQKVADAKCPTSLGEACKVPAWVVLAPTAVGVGALEGNNKELRIDLAVAGNLAVALGEEPAVAERPLPKISKNNGPARVALQLPLKVSKDVLNQGLAKAVKGKSFKVADKPDLKIDDVQVSVRKDPKAPKRLTVVAKVSGALDAELTLQGDVAYDKETEVLAVSSLSYDATTAALLAKHLSQAEQDAVRKKVAEGMSWKLVGQAKTLQKAANAALAQTIQGGLSLKGKLDELTITNIELDDGLSLGVSLRGKVEVTYVPK